MQILEIYVTLVLSRTNKREDMKSYFEKFFTTEDSLPGYTKCLHTFEYPLPYPGYCNFQTMSVDIWILDEAEYDPSYQLLLKYGELITVANYETIEKLELSLVNLNLSIKYQVVIVQIAK